MPTKSILAADRRLLLTIARATIVAAVSGQSPPAVEYTQKALQATCGCFVTIRQHGQLRGCIGQFTSTAPLWRTVQEMARAAALRDPRFYPMGANDLQDFSLEISVLSPLVRCTDPAEIQVGTHGIYLEKNGYHGVLLPQVAVEQRWDRETFLAQTCRKAGLAGDEWRQDADLYLFTAEVFGEG